MSLRPLNDEITRDKDGLVELFFANPALNDVPMVVEMFISVPSGIHVYGQSFGTAGAAGMVQGLFQAPPGTSRTISINIKSEKTGEFFIQFSGTYYPEGNKDLFNPISLTHPFTVREASADASSPSTTITEPTVARPSAPTPAASGGGSSCNPSLASGGANGAGDLALLLGPVLGLVIWRRRPWR